jgi:serine/threonine-protein phosphatase 2A regulatory subunit A
MAEDLYQIALLIDQLKHDDLQLRISSSKSLCRIAKVLGPERTRSELIPFLTESTDDDDEVLQIVAEQLGMLSDFVGGGSFTHVLLEPLECLAGVEDVSVRQSSIQSMKKIISNFSDQHLKEFYVPLMIRMTKKEWYTSRSSSLHLLHLCFERLSDVDRETIRASFFRLCTDETPNVRQAAAQNLSLMATKLTQGDINKSLISAITSLSNDEQDSVRIHCTMSCLSLLPSGLTQVLPIVLKASLDPSWRVRWNVASRLHYVFSAGHLPNEELVLSSYLALLNDVEPEVRFQAFILLSDLVSDH